MKRGALLSAQTLQFQTDLAQKNVSSLTESHALTMQPDILDLYKDLQPAGPSVDLESLSNDEKHMRKQRLSNVYKRKDNLVKKLWEIDVLARSIEPNTEVRFSIRLLGRYYIYNNGGWFPDEQFINTMDHPKPRRYTALSVADDLAKREAQRIQRAEKKHGRLGARKAEQKRALRKARNAIRWGKNLATTLSRGQVDDTGLHDPAVGTGDSGAGSIEYQDSDDGGGIEIDDGGIEIDDSDDGGIDFEDSDLGVPDFDSDKSEVDDGNGGMVTGSDTGPYYPHPAQLSRRLHHVLGVEDTHINDGSEAGGFDGGPASHRKPAERPRQRFQHRPSLAETSSLPSSTSLPMPPPPRQAPSSQLPHVRTSAKSELYVAIDTYQGHQRKAAHGTTAEDDLSRPQHKTARLPAAGLVHAGRVRNHSRHAGRVRNHFRHAGSGVQRQPAPRLGRSIDPQTEGGRGAHNIAPVSGGRVQKKAPFANRGS